MTACAHEEKTNTSFDCQQAKSAMDQLICDNNALSYLDQRLNFYYQQTLQQAISNKQAVINEQRDWLTSRNKICRRENYIEATKNQAVSHQILCLIDQYKKRNFALFQKLYNDDQKPFISILSPLQFADFDVSGPLSKDALNRLYTLRINGDGQFINGFQAHPSDTPVSTCKEYDQFGIDDDNTYDRAMGSFFLETCGPLKILRKAKVAKMNPFDGITISSVECIPLSFMPVFIDDNAAALDELAKQGVTLQNLIRQGKVKFKKKSPYQVNIEDARDPQYTSEVAYEEIAVADFSGDGIASMLITKSTFSRPGTLRYYDYGLVGLKGNPPQFVVKKMWSH